MKLIVNYPKYYHIRDTNCKCLLGVSFEYEYDETSCLPVAVQMWAHTAQVTTLVNGLMSFQFYICMIIILPMKCSIISPVLLEAMDPQYTMDFIVKERRVEIDRSSIIWFQKGRKFGESPTTCKIPIRKYHRIKLLGREITELRENIKTFTSLLVEGAVK